MDFYKKVNNVTGWLVFLFALVVYTLTLEATASFWDCGEFISGAWKMQVVHPPGAPLFIIVGRIFTLFAKDQFHAAWMVNFLSGLTSAFAVLFLFWITTYYAKKIMAPDGEPTKMQSIVIMLAGIVAGTCCTFLDSIWFSAVEGEVYASSIFFMMLVFWLMTKWEADTDVRHRNRWLVLAMYCLGISSGVHLLSFLAIPAMGLVYYYKTYKPTIQGVLLSLFVGVVVLGLFFKGMVTGITALICWFELRFVNDLSMPFGSGFLVFMALVIAGFAAGMIWSKKAGKPVANMVFLSVIMSLLGFSTYAVVIIRANADTPINMNNPSDAFMLNSYLNREQYGDRPLGYGPQYNAYPVDLNGDGKVYEVTGHKYHKGAKQYDQVGDNIKYEFADEEMMLFPRMGSWQDDRHVTAYRYMVQPSFRVVEQSKTADGVAFVTKKEFPNTNNDWTKPYAAAQRYVKASGNQGLQIKDVISQKENLQFFFAYQVGVMYWRYFAWNFTGRQNDIQGRFDNDEGRAATGIGFIDDMIMGPQKNLPEYKKANQGHNVYYMIPMILGIIGIYFHFKKDPESAFVILVLFAFTGILQVIYLNSPPFEPRERDYTLVGSFVTYCLWIGFGMIQLYEWLKTKLPAAPVLAVVFALCLSAPILMGTQNWDDHDRSNRTTCRDFAINYLESCAPNAIIFTQGDNDTYPLWYAQEVEEIRPDIRIVNLSLLGVDWYIQQLTLKMNKSNALKLIHTPDKYLGNKRDVTHYFDVGKLPQDRYYELSEIMKIIASDDKSTQVQLNSGEYVPYLPAKKFKITIDSAKVIANKMVPEYRYGQIVKEMTWDLGAKNNLLKNDLITLDIVASNIWERPIYFAVSVSPDAYLGMEKYFQLEGLSYRIVPVLNTEPGGTGYLATDISYTNVMKKFKWGGIEAKDTISYAIKSSEKVDDVAYRYNVTMTELKGWNGNADIKPGSTVKIVVPKSVYLDENIQRMTMNLRSNFARLAMALADQGKKDSARQVLDLCQWALPMKNVPYNVFMLRLPDGYYKIGDKEKAGLIMRKLGEQYEQELKYGSDVQDVDPEASRNMEQSMAIVNELVRVAKLYGDKTVEDELNARFARMQPIYTAYLAKHPKAQQQQQQQQEDIEQ